VASSSPTLLAGRSRPAARSAAVSSRTPWATAAAPGTPSIGSATSCTAPPATWPNVSGTGWPTAWAAATPTTRSSSRRRSRGGPGHTKAATRGERYGGLDVAWPARTQAQDSGGGGSRTRLGLPCRVGPVRWPAAILVLSRCG